VHTRSNFERKVADELAAKDINHFLPTFREVRIWKDRRKTIEVPLFPGYLFARINNCVQDRLKVVTSFGAVRILGPGCEIEPIPAVEIDGIRQVMNLGSRCAVHPLLREGAWVRVKYGPLAGLEGLLTRMKNQIRLVISIHLLGRSVSTEVSAHEVEAVPFALARPSRLSPRV
jgi:transcription antitermination factor NusG